MATIGYALVLLAVATAAIAQFVGSGQLVVADCGPRELHELIQLIAIGHTLSAAVVLAIGLGLRWRGEH